MTFSARARWLTSLAVGGSCVAAVVVFGELSTGALLAVGGTGVLVAVVGLARRAGEAALPVGRRGLPWLGWLAAAVAWSSSPCSMTTCRRSATWRIPCSRTRRFALRRP